MGNYRLRKVAHRLITTVALMTIVITTFWTGTQTPTRAAPASDVSSEQTASYTPVSGSTSDASPSSSTVPTELAPLNAMVMVSPDHLAALEKTITRAGGYVYVQQGEALFVGLKDLTPNDLMPVGARAVYQSIVPDREIAALSADDRAAVMVWNQMLNESTRQVALSAVSDEDSSTVILPTDRTQASRAQEVPTLDQQTSDYMVGSVAVRVLFVESTGVGTENWTEVEVNKVKTEIVQALDWWTTAATAPANFGGDPRPSANLEWNVSYVSPFEGSAEDRLKIQIPYEPISLTTVQAAADGGWMSLVAQHFLPTMPADGTTLRELANSSRWKIVNSEREQIYDWAFTLFVVDSSTDDNGYFQDGKAAGAALNGPYAFVSFDGGKTKDNGLGTENLEILIAKMVGHVFGAGDESWSASSAGAGCRPDEMYGYFRIEHSNCEFPNEIADPSLMRAGLEMIDAYRTNTLSLPARQQVGWYDGDNDGFYDVTDTLTDTFTGFSAAPACPVLHIANQLVENKDPLPGDVTDEGHWSIFVWDPVEGLVEKTAFFIPVNINWIGYVWGRIGPGEWVAGAPAGTEYGETRAWTRDDEGYTLYLPGQSGALNRVQIALMNRWEQQTYITENPVNVSVLGALNQPMLYDTYDEEAVGLYGPTGTLRGGWSFSPLPGAYGDATMLTSAFKSEACFAFAGREVTLYYSKQTVGVADVYVDGELHSTIRYTNDAQLKVKHVITNLAPGIHVVRLETVIGVIDFDAFQLTNSATDATQIIDALPIESGGTEIPVSASGFYEDFEAKLHYLGVWQDSTLPVGSGPGPGADLSAKRSSNAYDRFYFLFKNADAVAIYRSVFPGGGSAQVYLDGEEIGTMYNDATVARVMPFYIGGVLSGSVHTVEVRINPNTPYFELASLRFRQLATESFPAPQSLYTPASPGVPLDVAFNGAQDPNNGLWTTKTNYLASKDQGALLTMFFKGSAVAVNVGTGSSDGLLEMYVDGRLMRTVDTKSASSKDQPIIAHGFDSAFPHVLQVRQVNAKLTKPKVIQVYGYTVYTFIPVGPGSYEENTYDGAGAVTQSPFIYEQAWKPTKLITSTPGPSAQRYTNSAHDQARVYLYFQGADSLTIYATAGSYGAIDVYLNNELQGTFILKRSRTAYQVPFTLTGFDADETNVLELRVNTTLKLSKKINLDKVVLYSKPKLSERDAAYENDETLNDDGITPLLQFTGQWTRVANAAASGGNFEMSSAIGDQVVFDVTGATSVVITRRLYSKYGMVEVYVDDDLYGVFDSFTSSPTNGAFREHYVIAGLDPDFDHTIRLSAQRSGKKLDKFKPFDIDAVLVRSGDVAGENYLEDGKFESNDPSVYKLVGGGAIDYLGASWVTGAYSPSGGEPSTATTKGDKAIVLFKGNIFRIYVNMSSTSNKALVYIDSQLVGTIDSKRGTTVTEIPFTFVGLSDELHTAEIVIQGRFAISAYEALVAAPSEAGSYLTVPTNTAVYTSGLWTVKGDILETKQSGASLFFYVTNVDSLNIEHEVISTTGNIAVYVNQDLHSTIDATYIKSKLPSTSSTYLVSGLSTATQEGAWVEIRNPKAKLIGIKGLQALTLTHRLVDTSPIEEEAETVDLTRAVQATGLWDRKPSSPDSAKYSGGYYLESKNNYVHFYIPTQFLTYVTVYRPVNRSYGDATVYIDGVYWGKMPNSASSAQYQVPFSIGPIPDPAINHVIELRAASKKKFAVDKVVGYGMHYIDPGFYEDGSGVFVGTAVTGEQVNGKDYAPAYYGTWKVVTDVSASGGSFHQTTKRGSRLSAVFVGNQLTVYRRTSSGGKTMYLYIDGVAYPINNKSSIKTYNVPHTILLADEGPHSFELVADSGNLDFDAVEIKNVLPASEGAYQEDSVYVARNGDWTTVSGVDVNSGDAYNTTKQKYASAFFLFSGKQVTTYMTTGKNWGIMSVYLDGVFQADVNLYLYDKVAHPTDEAFFAYDLSGLEDTAHVLELRFEGKKDKKGKTIVNFDAITVNGYPVPKPGEHILPEESDTEVNVPMVGCFEDINPASPAPMLWTYYHGGDFGWQTRFTDFASGETDNSQTYHFATGNTGEQIYVEFTFRASGFSLMYVKYPSGGQAKLYVDGVPLDRPASPGGVISMYTPLIDGLWRADAIYTADGFDPNVTHVLRVEWVNFPVGSNIYIDRIDLPVYNPSCDPAW